jgi:RNA polymerase sigma factor (sigma-70 family)
VANVTDDRTDEELLAAIAAGPGALPEFYRRHAGRVVAAGARRFREPADVADFTAAVFLRVLESAPRFDPRRGSATAWLSGIANNVASEELRRRARAAKAELRISGRDLLADDDIERLERRIDAEADARAVHEALDRLPAGDRDLLRLVAVDGLTPAEAAGVLGISRISARVRLHRGRRRLRELIDDDAVPIAPTATRLGRAPAQETNR